MDPANVGNLLRIIERAAKKESGALPKVKPEADPAKSEVDEKQALEIDKIAAELQELRATQGRNRDIHKYRLIGLLLLFSLIVAWLVCILTFVYWTGTPANWHPGAKNHEIVILKLSDQVILALIGATTVNVLGLFYIAARWLYGEKQKPEG